MSRSNKDRPYAVKLEEARKLGKVNTVGYIRGKYSDRTLATWPDHSLSTVILKGNTAQVIAHRDLLESLDVNVVETEIKIPLYKLRCYSEKNKHSNDDTLYQKRLDPYGKDLVKEFPVIKYGDAPSCCYPAKVTERTCVKFLVYRWIQHTPVEDSYDDYDQRIISFPSPSKQNHTEHSERRRTKHVLHNLLRSNDVDAEWDDNVNLDLPVQRNQWEW